MERLNAAGRASLGDRAAQGGRWRLSYRQSLGWAALFGALSVMFLLFGLSIIPSPLAWIAERTPPDKRAAPNGAPQVSQTVAAHLTAMHEPQWSHTDHRLPHGQPLRQGSEWRLEAGMIEITFKSGARVAMEGPARFQILSQDRLHLAEGCLVATVHTANNPAAAGFTVDTAAAAIVDLGTQFGVAINDDRRVEVHVLEGGVEICEPGSKGTSDAAAQVKISEGESAIITADEDRKKPPRVVLIEPNSERFGSLIPGRAGSAAEHPLSPLKVLAHFRLGEDDADDGESDLNPGDELPAQSFDAMNKLALEKSGSLQYVRPVNVPQSRLGVAFTGEQGNYLAGPSIAMPAARGWVLEAWARASSRKDVRIIAYNGNTNTNGFGLMQRDGRWSAFFGAVSEFSFEGAPVELGRWTHLALVYERGKVRLLVDGVQVGPELAQTPHPPNGKFFIGGWSKEPFHGEIDEVRLSSIVGPFRNEYLLLAPSQPVEQATEDRPMN